MPDSTGLPLIPIQSFYEILHPTEKLKTYKKSQQLSNITNRSRLV